jgi:hypothetical protein
MGKGEEKRESGAARAGYLSEGEAGGQVQPQPPSGGPCAPTRGATAVGKSRFLGAASPAALGQACDALFQRRPNLSAACAAFCRASARCCPRRRPCRRLSMVSRAREGSVPRRSALAATVGHDTQRILIARTGARCSIFAGATTSRQLA